MTTDGAGKVNRISITVSGIVGGDALFGGRSFRSGERATHPRSMAKAKNVFA